MADRTRAGLTRAGWIALRVGPGSDACAPRLPAALNAAVRQQRLSVNPAVHGDLPTAQPRLRRWSRVRLGSFLDVEERSSTFAETAGALRDT